MLADANKHLKHRKSVTLMLADANKHLKHHRGVT